MPCQLFMGRPLLVQPLPLHLCQNHSASELDMRWPLQNRTTSSRLAARALSAGFCSSTWSWRGRVGDGDGDGDGELLFGLALGSVWANPNERLGLGLGFVIGRPPFAPFMACFALYSACFRLSDSSLLFFPVGNLAKTSSETRQPATRFDTSREAGIDPCDHW